MLKMLSHLIAEPDKKFRIKKKQYILRRSLKLVDEL